MLVRCVREQRAKSRLCLFNGLWAFKSMVSKSLLPSVGGLLVSQITLTCGHTYCKNIVVNLPNSLGNLDGNFTNLLLCNVQFFQWKAKYIKYMGLQEITQGF